MKRRLPIIASLVLAATLSALVVGGGTAAAQQPEPELIVDFGLPADAREIPANEPIKMSARLVDPAGNPIAGATVRFTVGTQFLNVDQDVDYGSEVTDLEGWARLDTELRTEGDTDVTVRFDGNAVFAPVQVTDSILVLPGQRTHFEVPPLRVPGANVWMVTAILSVVWGIYLVAMAIGLRIANAGGDA